MELDEMNVISTSVADDDGSLIVTARIKFKKEDILNAIYFRSTPSLMIACALAGSKSVGLQLAIMTGMNDLLLIRMATKAGATEEEIRYNCIPLYDRTK